MLLHDLSEFFRLSAALNYHLHATGSDREAVLSLVLGDKTVTERDRDLLLGVIEYLENAYGHKYRRLGPMAVLHPLRAAALLSRAEDEVRVLDLLTALLHDKLEDIVAEEYPAERWETLEAEFHGLLRRIDASTEWYLMERLDVLTRRPQGETYNSYLGRIVDRSTEIPELARVKLADRLDNTLYLRIEPRDPLEDADFFEALFEGLFLRSRRDASEAPRRSSGRSFEVARRLHEIFKNSVLLSLMRVKALPTSDGTARALSETITTASMREAQRIALEMLDRHDADPGTRRRLLMETMEYCQGGGIDSVTQAGGKHRLDGLFVERFDYASPKTRKERLQVLGQDSELMTMAAIAFIAIFRSFANDPDYYVRGIHANGIHPA
jgi:hypothetical protein